MQNILDTLKLSTAAKAWVGFCGLILQVILANVPLAHDSVWFTTGQVVLAALAAVGIYAVPNAPAAQVAPQEHGGAHL